MHTELRNRVLPLLDHAFSKIKAQDFSEVQFFLAALSDVRRNISSNEVSEVQSVIQAHPIFPVLLNDPYTHRAFSKPRNFAGDAELIDLFYGFYSAPEFLDATGRVLFQELMRLPSCDAVRYRRSFYGNFIDAIAASQSGPVSIMSLACGHLREVAYSRSAVNVNKVKVFGIDSDPPAIEEANRFLSHLNVELRNASVVDFIRHRAWGQTFDGVYSAGLFDYLEEKIARKVISAAYNSLRPAGRISIANFQPRIQERGYMDLVMDWKLIYRTKEEFADLASHLDGGAVISTWSDPMDSVVYLEIEKSA